MVFRKPLTAKAQYGGVGVGRFNGQNALAISASYHDDEYGLTYSVKVAQAGSGSNAGSVGVGWAF